MKFKTKNKNNNVSTPNGFATPSLRERAGVRWLSPLWGVGGLFFLLFVVGSLSAQVTIGSAKKPVDGALLMLDDGTTGGDANAKKGMMLPRVKLSDITKLKMGDAPEIVDGSTHERAKHTGLLVYHVSGEANPQCADIADGIYIWNGEEWTALKKPEAGTIDPATIVLKNGATTLTDGQKIHIASGADGRGATIPTLTLTAEWTGDGLVLTPTGKTGGQLSPFAPMISSPTWTSGTDVTVTNKPENIALTFADMSSLITASPTNPWVSREWELKFKVVDACGVETEKTVTINQTNYVMKPYNTSESLPILLKDRNKNNYTIQSNNTWRRTVLTDNKNILSLVSELGGQDNTSGGTGFSSVEYQASNKTNGKYQTALFKLEDTAIPKRAKDLTINVVSCLGTEDFSSLKTETAVNSARPDWETAWSDKVILHDAKVVGADRIYEEFTSADFGAAGRWMTTNLSAKAYDGIQHSQHPTRSLVQHDGLTTDRYNVAFWTYPNNKRAIVANEPASAEYTANPHLGLLYTWDAATAGKGGDTGQKNIYNTSGGEAANQESGFPEGTTTNQQRRIQGICPAGWHLPSDAEFTALENHIKNNTNNHSSMADIGGTDTPLGSATPSNIAIGTAMKDVCENGINASRSITDSGFSLLFAGNAYSGSADNYGGVAYVWSSSSSGSNLAWGRNVRSGNASVGRNVGNRDNLFSVRCKKDERTIRTDKDTYHLASGHDGRGAVSAVIAQITNEYPDKAITVEKTDATGNLAGMTFSPALETSLVAQQNHNYSIAPVAMTIANANNPWQSKESYLNFKLTNDKGVEVSKTVILNQTNYAFSVNRSFEDSWAPRLKDTDNKTFTVQTNLIWKASIIKDHGNILTTKTPLSGGKENIVGGSFGTIFNYAHTDTKTNTRNQTAFIKFEDTESPKRAKDMTVTFTSCIGTQDFSGLRTANPAETSGSNIWGNDVVRHLAKPNPAIAGENIYEDFISADFGDAGRWMTTNLSARAYDTDLAQNVYHSANRFLKVHDGTGSYHATALWAYPREEQELQATIEADEPPSSAWLANKYRGLFYSWDAATAGKGGSTGMLNIDNPIPGNPTRNEAGFPYGDGTNNTQKMRQGICPAGWHLPSDREWTDLENRIKNFTTQHSTLSYNLGTVDNDTPYGDYTPKDIALAIVMIDACESDSHRSKAPFDNGFSVPVKGSVYGDSSSDGARAYCWTSSSNISDQVWAREFWRSSLGIGKAAGRRSYFMFSVRCKKD